MTKIVEPEVPEPRGTSRLPEHVAHVVPTPRPTVWIREDPLAVVNLKLVLQDLSGCVAEDHRPRAGLRLRQQHDALPKMYLLPPKEPDLAEPHQRQRRELGYLAKR